MNKTLGFTLKLSLAIIFFGVGISTLRSDAASQMPLAVRSGKNIAVEINYGEARPARLIETTWSEGENVLDVLRSVAEVGTEPAGELGSVVASIDGVEGKRGEKAWYYSLDGQKAEKLASLQSPAGVRKITWSYQPDVCSSTVDKQS